MIGSRSDLVHRRGCPRFALVALACLGLASPAFAVDDPGTVTRPLAPSNTALLARAAHGAARRVVAHLPLTPGTRVGLRPEGTDRLDADMREALLQALNGRRITCVLLPPLAEEDSIAAAAAAGAPERPGAPGGDASGEGAAADAPRNLASLMREAQETQRSFDGLQAERQAQAARAESLSRQGGGTGSPVAATTALAAAPGLPILTWRVQEARVDYVRMFRGGIFGAHRIERRARADLALRLTPAGSDAIAWSASADSTVGDVVLRSELSALEDRTRPETRPQLPSASFKKVLEPALVVVLIAGLVSLFYQNRP